MKYRLILLALALTVSACGGASQTTSASLPTNSVVAQPTLNATSSPTAAPVLDASGEPLAARVNGETISRAEFERALTRSQQQSAAADPQTLAASVLDTLIEQAIIRQAAAEMNITVTNEEVDTNISEMQSMAGADTSWQAWLNTNMYTETEFREATYEQLLTIRVRDAVTSLQDNTVRQVRARHILVSTEAEAQDILRRLNAGEDFEALAAAFSRDVTTQTRGGDLGFFIASDLTTPELAEVAFSLDLNEIAGPVRTALGYHVIQTLEFSTREAAPEEMALQGESVFNIWLRERISAAQIERYVN